MRWETDEARAERVEDRGAFSRQCAALVMVSVRGMACVQDSCVRARGRALGLWGKAKRERVSESARRRRGPCLIDVFVLA